MLCLPSGEALFVNGTKQGFVYSNGLPPDPSWKPLVLAVPAIVERGLSYRLEGLQLNGVSTGSAYGDECNVATNYPLARLTNLQDGTVSYARTFAHSTMGVQTGDRRVRTHFEVPTTLSIGKHQLEVVASGIGSDPVPVYVADARAASGVEIVRGLAPQAITELHAFDAVARLRKSDDDYLLVFADPTTPPSSVPVQVLLQGTLGTALPGALALVLETSVTALNVVQRVELFNWQTAAFEAIDARPVPNEDALVALAAQGNLARFVDQATLHVTARVSYHTPLHGDPRLGVRFDRAGWLFGP
ncbi:MAG: hypothetical protein U1E76_04680 [Planctomycetota bacterium]